MSGKIDVSFWRDGQVYRVGHDFFCQVPVDFVDLYSLPNVNGLDVWVPFFFGQGLIDLLIVLNSIPEVMFCFFHGSRFVVETIDLNFMDVLTNDFFVIANRFDPNKLILAMYFPLKFFCNVLPPFGSCISTVEDCDFVLLHVDIRDQIVETWLSDVLSQLVVLLIIVIEKITSDFNSVIWIPNELPSMYLRR